MSTLNTATSHHISCRSILNTSRLQMYIYTDGQTYIKLGYVCLRAYKYVVLVIYTKLTQKYAERIQSYKTCLLHSPSVGFRLMKTTSIILQVYG